MMEGPRCRFGREARARDIDTAVVDGLEVLDPERAIREADIGVIGITQASLEIILLLE
jgi:hypothetical protein